MGIIAIKTNFDDQGGKFLSQGDLLVLRRTREEMVIGGWVVVECGLMAAGGSVEATLFATLLMST